MNKVIVVAFCVACSVLGNAQTGNPAIAASKTQIVMLGTGNPNNDPDRSGPATAIVVNGAVYLVDCGPGVVRRAESGKRKGIPALSAQNLKTVFITHLHSDHTLGYPDVIFSPWVLGREEPLKAYGPSGLQSMTDHILKAWEQDIRIRTTGGEPSNKTGYKVEVHEVEPGLIYRDGNVKVSAFVVNHGAWGKDAVGYIFETADKKIVISGDTAPTDAMAKACNGCDILIHEVYNQAGFVKRPPEWQKYHAAFHTSSIQLAKIASDAKPGLLVLYHQGFWGTKEEDLLAEVRSAYSGKVVSAHDLDIY
jgi:ribonuclease BN (tRNA processing enzyme)